MSDSIYRLVLRSDAEHSQSAQRAPMREHLERIPGVHDLGGGHHRFGEPDEDGVMEFDLLFVREGQRLEAEDLSAEEAATCNGIDVRIPRPWVMAKGPQVFALIFMMAEWNGWEVFDLQIEEPLQKEAVLQGLVAARQQQLELEGRGGPPGTQAHFASPDPGVVSSQRPARPEGPRMPRPEPAKPEPAPASRSQKKPWWKAWKG